MDVPSPRRGTHHPALRAALFAVVMVAVWAVARPAQAMLAPYCDDRGATGVAEPPVLQAPDIAVRRAHVAGSCETDEHAVGDAVSPGQGEPLPPAAHADPGLPSAAPVVVAADGIRACFAPVVAPLFDGVRFPIERPPRC
jgi:hypothetical protein